MNRPAKADLYDPLSDSFQRQEFPFYWVAQVNGLYVQEMERVLKRIDMDVTRWRILMILNERGEMSISEVAEHAVAKLPTITKILYRMRDQGQVDLFTSSTDGRVTLATLTETGHQCLNEVRESVSNIFKRSFQGLSTAQIQRLNRLLEKLYDNLRAPRD